MKIENNRVVQIHYTLSDPAGKTLDNSSGKDPLPYIHGTGALIPGLEKELAGVDLFFMVEIMSVREASPSELSHGHIHGPGGHSH